MDNNAQQPDQYPGQQYGEQQYPGPQYSDPQYGGQYAAQRHPVQQPHPGQDYLTQPGAAQPAMPYGQPGAPGYANPVAAPVRETGKRAVSMTLLVIGYVFGAFFLVAALASLPEVLTGVGAEGPAYLLGVFIGMALIVAPFPLLVFFMHRWRRRIARRELEQSKPLFQAVVPERLS